MSAVNLLSDDAQTIIIKTNEIQPIFRFEAIENDFRIFKLTLDHPEDKTERNKKYLQLMGELEENIEGVEAACQSDFGCFLYVLTTQDFSAPKLKQALHPETWQALSIHPAPAKTIEPFLLVRLFFNRTKREESDWDAHSISGTLCIFDSAWSHEKKNRISTLEISCSQKRGNPVLKMKVQSYTSQDLKQQITFHKDSSRKDWDDYPKFYRPDRGSCRLAPLTSKSVGKKRSKPKEYIPRQIDGTRAVIPCMKLHKLSAFDQTRSGALCRILEIIEAENEDYLALDFKTYLPDQRFLIEPKEKKAAQIRMIDFLEGRQIHLVTSSEDPALLQVQNALETAIHKQLTDIFSKNPGKKRLKPELTQGSEFVEDALNIHIVFPKKYYASRNLPDPYQPAGKFIIQHVTTDSLQSDIDDFSNEKTDIQSVVANATAGNTLNQLMIKDHIVREGRIPYWSEYGTDRMLEFWTAGDGKKKMNDQNGESSSKDIYRCLRVNTDGTMEYEAYSEQTLPEDVRQQLDALPADAANDLEGLVRDERGAAFAICKTSLSRIPQDLPAIRAKIKEDEAIRKEKNSIRKEELSLQEGLGSVQTGRNGKKQIRAAEFRDKLLGNFTDVVAFRDGNHIYYSAGIISKGMNTSIQNFPRVRECVALSADAPELIEKTIPMLLMNLSANFNKQTVLPFPFKYLNEYSMMKFE